MMTTFLSLIKIMLALVIVCYSWSSASTLSGPPLASNSSQLNGASPQPPLALKSAFSSGLAWGSDECYNDISCQTNIIGSVCVDGKCTCPVGYTAVDGEMGMQSCKVDGCGSLDICYQWPNSYCSNDKCVCIPGYLEQKAKCVEIPTEPPITTTSTTSSTTSTTTTSTTPSTTTSSTSSTTSSTGCKPSDCSSSCQANAVCMKLYSMCACRCPIGLKERIEPDGTYCDPYDCAQEKKGCYWPYTFCRAADHKCACKHGYQLDPDDPSTCEPIPGWTTQTADSSAPKMSTSTDVSAKVGAFLWKTVLWIIGIVVVLILVAICIAIVVCCFCCKSDKSKQVRYNSKSNAPMAPSKYPPMVAYPTPGSSDYGKGGPILVAIPGTSGLKASNVVGGSKVPNPPMALYPVPDGYPQANLVAVPGPIGSKVSKAVPSNGSKVPNPPYPKQ